MSFAGPLAHVHEIRRDIWHKIRSIKTFLIDGKLLGLRENRTSAAWCGL